MHATDALNEADRQITICNACRYCEGLCPVFPALEMQRSFTDGDLNYLANLCHSCGACYYDCQFAPPHEFGVNIAGMLAEVRNDSYETYAWPRVLAPVFRRNGLLISVILAVSVAVFILGFVMLNGRGELFAAQDSPQGFYALMPHNAMAALFGATFLFALMAIALSVRNFWRDTNASRPVESDGASILTALKDAATLHHLDGGGVGCYNEDEYPTDRRRLYHHLTFYGFLLCFAATSVGTLYHYFLDRPAPYAWWDLPPLLGIAGGIALSIGTYGLLAAKKRRMKELRDMRRAGMEIGFVLMLFLTATTGLALRVLGETPLMGILLAVHLGVVFSLFVALPYSKFVHGFYRVAALCRYAMARRHGLKQAPKPAQPATLAGSAQPATRAASGEALK